MIPLEPTASFPYRIVATLGEGAMGEVYRAEDLELGRPVAIKVIKPSVSASLSGAQAQVVIERFLQEARAAAGLSHPGVPAVHRIGTIGSWPYIAMEWIDGRTLEEVLASQRRIPVEQAARVALQVLSVLEAAHRAGIVHRDLKPANIMVTRDRRLKVMDFGVARVEQSAVARTQLGMIVGTPQYAAPEQLAGRAVDGRADLYSVGVVLFELVTGRPPFEASSVYELMGLVQTSAPPRVSELVPGVDPAFDVFLQRVLAKAPEDRFASAAEMALAVQPFLTSGTERASQVPDGSIGARRSQVGREVPTMVVDADSTPSLVASVVRTWPATALGRQSVSRLLDRILEKPLHAPAFCGAVAADSTLLLVSDGVLFGAFDLASGDVGDAAVERLPVEVDTILYSIPRDLDPRLLSLLASLLDASEPRLSGLDASYVDIPQLADKLAVEGFDGSVRFHRDGVLGVALFSRGRRVLDVFGRGFENDARSIPWQNWIASSGVTVSIEDRRPRFPSLTFRRQLRGTVLEVHRPSPSVASAIRRDARQSAESLELRRPVADPAAATYDSTWSALVAADPAVALARWLLVDVDAQFEQFRRRDRWRAMIDPLADVRSVVLHPDLATGPGRQTSFDLATLGEDGRYLHVMDRVAVGSAQAVAAFLGRVTAARSLAPDARDLTGAVLVAPSFDDAALSAYFDGLRAARGALRAAFDVFSHREGFLTVGRGGCHVLLVEEVAGRRRPLVPDA